MSHRPNAGQDGINGKASIASASSQSVGPIVQSTRLEKLCRALNPNGIIGIKYNTIEGQLKQIFYKLFTFIISFLDVNFNSLGK